MDITGSQWFSWASISDVDQQILASWIPESQWITVVLGCVDLVGISTDHGREFGFIHLVDVDLAAI